MIDPKRDSLSLGMIDAVLITNMSSTLRTEDSNKVATLSDQELKSFIISRILMLNGDCTSVINSSDYEIAEND